MFRPMRPKPLMPTLIVMSTPPCTVESVQVPSCSFTPVFGQARRPEQCHRSLTYFASLRILRVSALPTGRDESGCAFPRMVEGRGAGSRIKSGTPVRRTYSTDGPDHPVTSMTRCGRSHRIIPARAVSPHRGLRRSHQLGGFSANLYASCVRTATSRCGSSRVGVVVEPGFIGSCNGCRQVRPRAIEPPPHIIFRNVVAAQGDTIGDTVQCLLRPNLPRRNATRSCSRLPGPLSIKRNVP